MDRSFIDLQTKEQVESLLYRFPTRDRGDIARQIYRHRAFIEKDVVRHALLTAWDGDPGVVSIAFGSPLRFARAVKSVTSRRTLPAEMTVYRGFIVDDGAPYPVAFASGISWTTRRDTACWFAFRYPSVGRPVVIETVAPRAALCAAWDDRNESEVVIDYAKLDWQDGVRVSTPEGPGPVWWQAAPEPDPDEWVSDWRARSDEEERRIKAANDLIAAE